MSDMDEYDDRRKSSPRQKKMNMSNGSNQNSDHSSDKSYISINYQNENVNLQKEFISHDYWRQFSAGLYRPQNHVKLNRDKIKIVKLPSLYDPQSKSSYDLLYESLRKLNYDFQKVEKKQINNNSLESNTLSMNYTKIRIQNPVKLVRKKFLIEYNLRSQKNKCIKLTQKEQIQQRTNDEKIQWYNKIINNIERSNSADRFQNDFFKKIGVDKWKQQLNLQIKTSIQQQMKQLIEYKSDDPLKNLLEINKEMSISNQRRFKNKNKRLYGNLAFNDKEEREQSL